MTPGDIVRIFTPHVGYHKYHLCLRLGDDAAAARFLFINSEARFQDTLALPNARVSCIPPNDTGQSCFSFNMLPRYSDEQLKLYGATVIGQVDLSVALELRSFADGVRSLTRGELVLLKQCLDAIISTLGP